MWSLSKLIALQGLRLLQLGVALLLFTSFEGFAIPYFAVPNLGRSVHTLSAFAGVLFLALGLVWPRLNLGAAGARGPVLVSDLFSPCHDCWLPDRGGSGEPAARSYRWQQGATGFGETAM
jgi:hypothetical protein